VFERAQLEFSANDFSAVRRSAREGLDYLAKNLQYDAMRSLRRAELLQIDAMAADKLGLPDAATASRAEARTIFRNVLTAEAAAAREK
jgi:hypothetical protein